MKRKDNSTGKIGEEYTTQFLKKNKYSIIATNYRCRFGEIDIVAQKDKYIVFVEVKTRDENARFAPIYAVNFSKRQKIIKTAQIYLMNEKVKLQPRFDVACVTTINAVPTSIEYIENAFQVET